MNSINLKFLLYSGLIKQEKYVCYMNEFDALF